MNTKNLFTKIIISFFTVGIFWALESGFSLRNGDELIKSTLFAIVFFIAIEEKYRKYLLITSIILFLLMIFLYLFWQIAYATFFGSMGFGILCIYVLSFVPDLIKRGFVGKK